MTNTKFRKRALLSSVAMLLVALVALGSATFAWFVANPTATASGLVMNTKADAGLAVASGTVKAMYTGQVANAFKSETILNATGSAGSETASTVKYKLEPVAPLLTALDDTDLDSTTKALTFGSVQAQYASSVAANPTENVSGKTSGFYTENIYLKTTATAAGETVTAQKVAVNIDTASLANISQGVKVALVAHQGVVGEGSASDYVIGIWKADSGQDSKVWNGTAGVPGTVLVNAPANTYYANKGVASISLTADNSTENNYVSVYVYLDGENANVYSNNVPDLTDIANSISVRFSTSSSATSLFT